MQTFLTFRSFQDTARSLDRQRLGKQRVEAYQILLANSRVADFQKEFGEYAVPSVAWRNHPAVLMWRHYDGLLAVYGAHMSREWKAQGYKDTLLDKFLAFADRHPLIVPPWMTDSETLDKVIRSHRYSLVQKDPDFYGPIFPEMLNTTPIPYYWPRYSRPAHYFTNFEETFR